MDRKPTNLEFGGPSSALDRGLSTVSERRPSKEHGRPGLEKKTTFLSRFKSQARTDYEHMAANMVRSTQLEITMELTEWSRPRAILYEVLEHPAYSLAIGIVIVMNAILVIVETDQKASHSDVAQWIIIASLCFLGVYSIEILVRFYVFRSSFFKSGWNCLDLFVVLTDLIIELSKIWKENDMPSVSVLRVFRLARLIRLIAMLSAFHELQTMLLGFVSAMKAIFWASFMIFVVLTVCSIGAVEFIHPLNLEVAETGAYENCARCGRAFESVLSSNLTFIQQIIAGDSWGAVTIPIIEAYPAAGIFFLIVFGLIDLGLLNLILTVIVNAAEAARHANHEILLREKAALTEQMKHNLVNLCGTLDHDGDGRITQKEFLDGVQGNDELRKTLALLDIQAQDCMTIYHLMDEDESGDVDYHEFVNAMINTKFESIQTKLLFLKAHIQEVVAALKDQERVMKHEVVGGLKGTKDLGNVVAHVVKEAMKRGFAEVEFEKLVQKFDWRWEELHMQQTKTYQVLEKVLTDLYRGPQSPGMELRGNSSRPSVLSSLSMPPSCTRCEVEKSTPVSGTGTLRSDRRGSNFRNGFEWEASKAGPPTTFFFQGNGLAPDSPGLR